MKREERNEYNYIRRNLREMISSYDSTGEKPYGNTLTIRTDAGSEYKKALHTLYTFYGFHPAGITEDAIRYDGKEREAEIEEEAEKKLYTVASNGCLFFVYTDLTAPEIEHAYLTELNSKFSPKDYYTVTETTLNTVNSFRYGSQPVYKLRRVDKAEFTWLTSVIRSGGRQRITQSDLV